MNKFICEITETHPHSIAIAKANMPGDEEVQRLSSIFKVLSDPTRVKLLLAMKEQEMCVCDLAACLNMTKSAISHQLRILKQSRLITARREGKQVFYSLADDHVHHLLDTAIEHLNER